MDSASSLSVLVHRKVQEAANIISYELVAADGGVLPSFEAGAHIDVETPSGVTRQYSLSNDPAQHDRYVIGVLLDPNSRGGSKALHAMLTEQQMLRISKPKNHFPLVTGRHKSLLLAGGIGITPMLSMAEQLVRDSNSFELHYCSRSREHAAFVPRIESSAIAKHTAFHFDSGPSARRLDMLGLLRVQPAQTHLYVCGPKGFIDAARNAARDLGWNEDRVHFELFAGELVRSSSDEGFAVTLASSGRVIQIGSAQTVVEALLDVGIELPTSCEQGVCGTCLTRVLDGQPDHRDSYLTAEEQARGDQFLPCCSRSKSPMLVLDL